MSVQGSVWKSQLGYVCTGFCLEITAGMSVQGSVWKSQLGCLYRVLYVDTRFKETLLAASSIGIIYTLILQDCLFVCLRPCLGIIGIIIYIVFTCREN